MKHLLRRLVLAGLALLMGVSAAVSAPAMWRVSDGDSHIWLFGSIHILGKVRNWRTPQFDAALKSSRYVYFEMVLTPETTARMLRLSMVYGRNRDGRRLSDYLTVEQQQTFYAFLDEHGLDAATYETMRPWYALLNLSQALMEPGAMPAVPVGVETVIETETDDSKERGLETAETQFRIISGGTDAEQVEALMSAINDTAATDAVVTLDQMTSTWQRGDIEALAQQMMDELGAPETPLYRRYLTDRNRRWVTELEKLLASNDETMVIVGAAHLGGPVGLPTLFSELGYEVERVTTPPARVGSRRQF